MTVTRSWCFCAAFVMFFTYVKNDDPQCANFTIPGCTCVWFEVIFGITCNNETELSKLPRLLDSTFDVNRTYELIFQDIPALPPRVIDGLIVFRVVIDNPNFTEVHEEAFDEVLRLRWFHIYLSSLVKVPNFEKVPHSLRHVNIDNSLLTTVEGEFQNLPLLKRLSLRNNTIQTIAEDAFRGTTNIEYLDLSYNRIASLPSQIFYELNILIKLALSYNRLHTIDGLFDRFKSTLKFLNLEFNNLTDVDDALHANLTGLRSLSLNSNPLGKITSNTFKKAWVKLRFVSLDHCNLTDFRVENFKNLQNLSSLDLSYNQITNFGNESLDFGNNFDLILSGNEMESFGGGITPRTKRLFYMENNLRRLGALLQYTQMTEVDVSRNHLIAVEAWDFQGSHNTENLAFRENEIETVDDRCFYAFRNTMHTLDLSNNHLTNLNRSVQYLSRLKALNVSYNFLETLDNEEFVGLNELSELYLQHNKIMFLRGQIHSIPSLLYLILQNNSISHLELKDIPTDLQYLYISGNPINCNCRFYQKFLRNLNGSPELDEMPCTSSSVSEDVYEPCPSPCGCKCKSDANASFVSVDCSSRFLTSVPHALSNWSIFTSPPGGVYRIDDPRFAIYDYTLSLNLSNNSIEALKGVYLSRNLKELFLDDNILTTLPYSIMSLKRLREVTLSGNRWSCDCDDGKALEFRKWMISKNGDILDVNVTRCYNSNENKELVGKVIVAAAEADLCPNEIAMYITLTFAVLCVLLLCAGMKIMYTRYEINIKVWLYSKGVTWVKEKDIDKDKRFDAFLSFSHMDQDFVTEAIIDEIEMRSPNINLCIHYRHFVPGKFIHENIIDAVNNSKRTVLILTKNFLESEWCMMEFRAADVQNIKDKVRRVIVIKAGELPSNMDPSIKVYLDSTTYLTWGEKYFWQKFLYALPKPSPFPRTARSTMTLLS